MTTSGLWERRRAPSPQRVKRRGCVKAGGSGVEFSSHVGAAAVCGRARRVRSVEFSSPRHFQTRTSPKGRRTRERRCRLRGVHALRARARPHARSPCARTHALRAQEPLTPPPLRCLHANHYGAQRFTRRPFHASSDALRLTLRLAKQAFECVHKWVGAASASTSLPLCPDCRRAVPTVRHGCLGAGPSRRTLRWLVVAPPHMAAPRCA